MIINKKMLILFGRGGTAKLMTILIAVLAMKIPVVPVCVIVLIEVAIKRCLQEVSGWVMRKSLQYSWLPVLCGRAVFCLLCILIYVFAILTLGVGSKSGVMIRPL